MRRLAAILGSGILMFSLAGCSQLTEVLNSSSPSNTPAGQAANPNLPNQTATDQAQVNSAPVPQNNNTQNNTNQNSSQGQPAPTSPLPSQPQQAAPANQGAGTANNAAAGTTLYTQLYDRLNPSVVSIITTIQSNQSTSDFPGLGGNRGSSGVLVGQGSGWLYDTQGHIVTNNHVVEGAINNTVLVSFSDGTTAEGQVVGTDPGSDIGVVRVDLTGHNLQPFSLANSDQVKIGEETIAIGNPFGLPGTLTHGIVSARGRSLNETDPQTGQQSGFKIFDLVQTDTPINPGNSGGPLIDMSGHVIGMNTAIESQAGQSSGVGFAVPANQIQRVAPALIQTGHYDHPYLGIQGTEVTASYARATKLSVQNGVLVTTVVPNGPGAKAGLRGSNNTISYQGANLPVGGDVITAVNGQQIKVFDDLVVYLERNTKPGQQVPFTILRNGQQQTVTITLGVRPATTPPQ